MPGDLLVYGYKEGKKWHGHVVILIDKDGKRSGHKGLVLGAHDLGQDFPPRSGKTRIAVVEARGHGQGTSR